MKFFKDLAKRWKKKQFPTSDTETLDPHLLRRDIGFGAVIFLVGALFCLLVVRCTRSPSEIEVSKEKRSIETSDQPAQEPQSHMIYFGASGQSGGVRARPSNALSRGTLVRVRLLNSVQTFETVPAFAQVVDYALGRNRYGSTLIGDASGDGSIERIKITFNTLKLQQASSSIAVEGQALSLDGTLGIRAEKLEGFMGRAVTSGAQAGSAGLGGLGGAKGDLNQLLLKALLSGLQTELSADLSAAHNQQSALSLNPGTEFYVQLTSDFSESSR